MANTDATTTQYRPEISRRVTEIPGVRPSGPASLGADAKRLIVGREISLSGEIEACETLVVEGRVEASLSACQTIDISAGGLFKGIAEVDDARISGDFEGSLTVRNRLVVHATGRISGAIRYREIEIQRGGQVAGDIQALGGDEALAQPAPAARRSEETAETAKPSGD